MRVFVLTVRIVIRSRMPTFVFHATFLGKEIQTAYLESYSQYGQNIFDRYITYADLWFQDLSMPEA